MKLWNPVSCQIVAMWILLVPTAVFAQKSSPAVPVIKTIEITNSLGEKMTMTTRRASFLLGKNLAYQAALGARKVPREKFADSMVMTKRFAEALSVELGDVPEVTDFSMIWDMLSYVGDGKSGISGKIGESQGKECAALVRLSSMTLLAPSLYSNDFGDDEDAATFQRKTNNYVKSVIGKSMVNARFTDRKSILSALGPFYDKMDNEESVEELGKLVSKTINAVDALLTQELVRKETASAGVEDSQEDIEAKAFLAQYLKVNSQKQARDFTVKLMPTQAACDAVLKPELAARAEAVYKQLFSDSNMVLNKRPNQTEVRLRKVTAEQLQANDQAAREFPGGYRKVASKLKSGVTIYQFTFVEPGEERGMRYDGLIKVGDSWFLFPKLWRLLDEEPFGQKIPAKIKNQ